MLTSDTLSRRVFLFTTVPPIPFKTYRQSLEKLLEFDAKALLPGHDLGLVPTEWLHKMIGMLDSFTPEKGREYDRPEFNDSLMLYTVGKGYGDPEYFGFGYCAKEMDILLHVKRRRRDCAICKCNGRDCRGYCYVTSVSKFFSKKK